MTCNETESQEKYSKHTSNFRSSTPTPLEGGKGEILTDHHKLDTYTFPPRRNVNTQLRESMALPKGWKREFLVVCPGCRRAAYTKDMAEKCPKNTSWRLNLNHFKSGHVGNVGIENTCFKHHGTIEPLIESSTHLQRIQVCHLAKNH